MPKNDGEDECYKHLNVLIFTIMQHETRLVYLQTQHKYLDELLKN